ncbi:sensor histidine kinase [Neglectibacter caecimuris]|uniref:sensor histidine kinase n=1 Tax=Neglectibacter caecimuris TaxID=3093658 RepID=UPI002AC967BA|nr:histidine kinase [Neglectibacter sp. M00184]
MKISFRHVRSRIAVYTVLALLITMLLCWITMLFYFSNVLRQQMIEDNYKNIRSIAARIDGDYEYAVNYAQTIVCDETLCANLKEYYDSQGFRKFSYQMKINKAISNYIALGKNVIFDLYVVDRDSSYSISSSGVFDEVIRQDWYRDFLFSKQRQVVTEIHQSINYYRTHETIETFSFIIPFIRYDRDFETLGYLVMDFSMDNMLAEMFHGENQYFISDERLFYSNTEGIGLEELDFTEEVLFRNGKYYLKAFMPNLGKNFVGIIDQSYVNESVNKGLRMILITFSLGSLLALVFVIYLSKTITRPVLRLTEGMKRSVASRFSMQLEVTGRDELAEMTKIFNTMQLEIKDLIQQNEQIHRQERELQFKYYMSKINPHFMYNSLNCVIYLARKQKYRDIISFIRSLITILKTNVAAGDFPITIKEEEEYLLHYFDILKYQYNDSVTLALDIPEALAALRIRPMILYPLVENSVFHGIAPLGREGSVRVRIHEENGNICFCVSDTGIGMTEERLQEVLAYIEDSATVNFYGNIGLKNVSDRLKLLYPSCSGLRIVSKEGEGTEITFVIAREELR